MTDRCEFEGPDEDAEFRLLQDGMVVASAIGPRARAEQDIAHYALVYGQDGPVEVREVKRRRKAAT